MKKKIAIKRKRRPTHPGAILREDLLPVIGISQSELASLMGVSRRAINELCQERRGVSTDMAHRLARVFGNSPEFWLRMQQAVDLWDELQSRKHEYERIKQLVKSAVISTAELTEPLNVDFVSEESSGKQNSIIRVPSNDRNMEGTLIDFPAWKIPAAILSELNKLAS